MTHGHGAASVLKLFAWLFLIGSMAWVSWLVIQTALIVRDAENDPRIIGLGFSSTALFLVVVSILAGGPLLWAMLIGISTLIDNSIEQTELARIQAYREYEEYDVEDEPVNRVVRRIKR